MGTDALWILGDNFVAKSFWAHYKKYVLSQKDGEQYIKEFYEYSPVCNSRFASSQVNMLARLQNALATGLNGCKGTLPKYILVILDDDLINFLDCKEDEGIATLLGSWVEWLADQFDLLIQKRLEQLPVKTRKVVPFFYWVATPTHSFFSKPRNQLRIKFNLGLEAVIRAKENMRVIKLKTGWNSKDSNLVVNDRITELGMTTYWSAIDASFKYNILRREAFLAKQCPVKNSSSPTPSSQLQHDQKSDQKRNIHPVSQRIDSRDVVQRSNSNIAYGGRDPMSNFFRRHRYDERHRDIHEDR